MCLHLVPFKHSSITYFAVCQFVIVEIGRGGEAFVTDITLMRLFTRMNATMGVQRGRRGKGFRTQITLMWFFT